MTGEITLRGRVLPIGGLKEKLLAAHRGGIKKVLIPEENAKDLAEIPDNVKSGLEIMPVARMGEVLVHALVRAARADRMDARRSRKPPSRRLRGGRRRRRHGCALTTAVEKGRSPRPGRPFFVANRGNSGLCSRTEARRAAVRGVEADLVSTEEN